MTEFPNRSLRHRCLLVGLALLLTVSFVACDSDVVLIDPTGSGFSLYGVLSPDFDTQWVRVFPVQETLGVYDEPRLNARFVSRDLHSGEQFRWTDSLLEVGDGRQGYAYWSHAPVERGHTYSIEMEDLSSGVATQVEVDVPPLVHWTVAWDREVRDPIYEDDVIVGYDTLYEDHITLRPRVNVRSALLHCRVRWVKQPGDTVVRVDSITLDITRRLRPLDAFPDADWLRYVSRCGYDAIREGDSDDGGFPSQRSASFGRYDAIRERDGGPSPRDVHEMKEVEYTLRLFVANDGWNAPNGTWDPEWLIEPSVLLNVENGWGYVASGYLYDSTFTPPDTLLEVER